MNEKFGNQKSEPVSCTQDNTESLLIALHDQLGRIKGAIYEAEDIVTVPRPSSCCATTPDVMPDTVNEQLRVAIGNSGSLADRLFDLNRSIKATIGDIRLLA